MDAPTFLEPAHQAPSEPEPSGVVQLAPRIEADPDRLSGKPSIRGTRIRVGDLLGWLAVGMTAEEIVADYPSLQAEDIPAALEYASRVLMAPVVFPMDGRPTH